MAIKSREDFERAYDEWLMNAVVNYGINQPIRLDKGDLQLFGGVSRGHIRFDKLRRPTISPDALIYLKSRGVLYGN